MISSIIENRIYIRKLMNKNNELMNYLKQYINSSDMNEINLLELKPINLCRILKNIENLIFELPEALKFIDLVEYKSIENENAKDEIYIINCDSFTIKALQYDKIKINKDTDLVQNDIDNKTAFLNINRAPAEQTYIIYIKYIKIEYDIWQPIQQRIFLYNVGDNNEAQISK